MPNLISIAVETSKYYVALDSEGRVWRGQRVTKRGGPTVKWLRVTLRVPAERPADACAAGRARGRAPAVSGARTHYVAPRGPKGK